MSLGQRSPWTTVPWTNVATPNQTVKINQHLLETLENKKENIIGNGR